MKKSKLITLLSTFSKEEMKRFEKFISSPYFNNERNFKPLYKVLKSQHPGFLSDMLTEEKLFKKLYPGKGFDKKSSVTIRVLLSKMTVMAESFLKNTNDHNNTKETLDELHFLRILRNRKLDDIFMNRLMSFEKSLFTNKDFYHKFFKIQMELESEKCEFLIDRNRQQAASEPLLKQSEYFIYYFLIEFFKLIGHIEINEEVFNAEFKNNLAHELMQNINFTKILDFMKTKKDPFYPVIAIYYNCLMSRLDVKDDVYFQNFTKLLKENIDLFSRNEKYTLLLEIQNCYWKRLRYRDVISNNSTRKDLFEHTKFILKHGLYKWEENGFITLSFFRNAIVCALNVNKIDWMEKFIANYSNELPPEIRESMYNYGMAIVSFEKGKFEKSLKHILKVNIDYFYLKIDVKNLHLRIYYELNLFETAQSLIDSYKHFLSKNITLSKIFRQNNSKFLNYYIQLTKIKNGNTFFSLKKIRSEVTTTTHIAHKGWIIKKIDELEKHQKNKMVLY